MRGWFRRGKAKAATVDNGRPKRIQLKRSKGWRLPPNTRSVARPSRWGNRFKISPRIETDWMTVPAIKTAEQAVALHREWILGALRLNPGYLEPLRGKNLACWCPLDQPCHADTLLELANADKGGEEAA